MPNHPVSIRSAPHYTWGGPNATDADGWHLLRTPDLSIIEERMPPGSSETRHVHTLARQFFYVLSGALTLELSGTTFTLLPGEALEVPPGEPHQARNTATTDARFLITSQPPSHGDRTPAPSV